MADPPAPWGGGGNGAGALQVFGQEGGLFAEEHANAVNVRLGRGLQHRDGGLGGGHLGVGVGHVQFPHKPGFIALVGDAGGFLLGRQVLFGDGDLVLQTPEGQVVRAHFPHQGDQHVPAVLHGSGHIRGGRLDVAAGAPEDVELPGGVEACLE